MKKNLEPIFHITTEKEWKDCVDVNYYPNEFSNEGFIHFSTRKQLVNTANRIFIKRDLLFILEVEQEGLEIVYENLGGGVELYPHLYTGLPIDKVNNQFIMNKNEEGIFHLNI